MVQFYPPGPRPEEWRYFLQLLQEVSEEQQALLEERARLRARVRKLEDAAGQDGGLP